MTSDPGGLLTSLPPVRRARGYRLYTVDDRRILDLYQEAGRAALGHRPGKLVHDIKNVLERGVLSAFPSRELARARRHVRDLFPSPADADPILEVRFFLTDRLCPVPDRSVVDLAHPQLQAHDATGDASPVPLWRPWLPEERMQKALALFSQSGVMIAHLPLPSLFAVQVRIYCTAGQPDRPIPEGALVGEPALKALSVTSVLLAKAPAPVVTPLDGFDSLGPYLWMRDRERVSFPEYQRRFAEFLDRGILISPHPLVPSVFPAEISDGERRLLVKAAAEVMGDKNGN